MTDPQLTQPTQPKRTGRGGGRGRGRGRGRGGRGGRGGVTASNNNAEDVPTDAVAGLNINAPAFEPTQGQGAAGRGERRVSAVGVEHGRGSRGGGGRGAHTSSGSSKKEYRAKLPAHETDDDMKDEKAPHQKLKQESRTEEKSKAKKLRAKKEEKGKETPKLPNANKKGTNDKASTNTSSNTSKPTSPSIPPSQSQQTSDIYYGKGQKISIFHVAEKPSIAQAIAHGLSHGNTINFRKKILPVHEFSGGTFPKAPYASSVNHRISSVAGHVFETDFGAKYQSWESVDPMELFQAPIIRKPSKGSVVKHLQDEAKGCDFIVLWMDCDREGENINFEVLDCCMHLMKGGTGIANFDRVYRAYFSAVNPSDIQKAYQALGKPDKYQAMSVDARQELDLKIGVAFSRFQSRYFQGRYGDLNSAVVSYGPCQTPTLGFCVQRHIDIETFKPEPYWVLELGVLKRGRILRATWEAGRSFNKSKTESLIEKALDNQATVIVSNVVIQEKKQGRPIPLNTVALLKACSKALGIGPHAAMQTAERLYLSGYLSYPRTESSAYPKSFDIKETLEQQVSDSRWGGYVRELLVQGHTKARGGVDMGDHPPITPCRSAGVHELSGDAARIYELVVRHFVASVSHDAIWQSTKIDLEIAELSPKGRFYLTGKQLVTPGFLAVLLHKEYGDKQEGGDEDDEEERTIPEFKVGEVIPLLKGNPGASSSKVGTATAVPVWAFLDIKEKKTIAPGYLTESELLGLMEKHGIGTDASMATHIENIQKRNYVRLESGRRLVPNKLGLVLVQGYHSIDSGLVLPKVRSDIEGQCLQIAKGLAEKEVVLKRAIETFENKFAYFVANIGRMDVLFASSFSKLEDVGQAFTRCGLTRRYLQFIPGPPPRLYNRFTETVYPLPVGGDVKQWSGRSCPICNFELCLYSVGAPPRTFPLCPSCFNSQDWCPREDDQDVHPSNDAADKADEHKERQIKKMAGKSLTLGCPLPDNHPLIDELYVSPDPDSDGIFILDPHFGPKWRLVATRDATIIHLPKSIDKLTILNEREEILGCHKVRIEFKHGLSPLPDGSTKHTCFYPTDATLQNASRVFHGSERTASSGRGRGRGGRGRRSGRGRQ